MQHQAVELPFRSVLSGWSIPAIVLSLYFAPLLVPNWRPSVASSPVFFFYILSIPFTLLVLLIGGLWGVVGAIVLHRRRRSVSTWHRHLIIAAATGLLLGTSTILLTRLIRGSLPTGSYVMDFTPVVWQDPGSSEFVDGDITLRQKMLGSLARGLRAEQNRADIEALLGPSLETPYFDETGRDLIYIMGPERDSFFGMDSEWLLIWLDDSGHFEKYEIRTD